MPLTPKERQDRYRANHSHTKAFKKRKLRAYHRRHFGEYRKKSRCEIPSCRASGKKRRLLPHHRYFDSCSDCMPDRRGEAFCHIEAHLLTVCRSCHQKLHRRDSWRVWRELEAQDRHLESISKEERKMYDNP